MYRKMIMLAVLVGGMMGSAGLMQGAAAVDNDSTSKFNNENPNGMWSLAIEAIELGNLEYIKSLVPSKIARTQERNFPNARYTHKKTLFDIAAFHAGNRAGKPDHLINTQIEIAEYLNPQQEAKEEAAAVPINLIAAVQNLLSAGDVLLAKRLLDIAFIKEAYKPIVFNEPYIRSNLIPLLDEAIVQADDRLVAAIVDTANEAGYVNQLDLPARFALFNQLYIHDGAGTFYDPKGVVLGEQRGENPKVYKTLANIQRTLKEGKSPTYATYSY